MSILHTTNYYVAVKKDQIYVCLCFDAAAEKYKFVPQYDLDDKHALWDDGGSITVHRYLPYIAYVFPLATQFGILYKTLLVAKKWALDHAIESRRVPTRWSPLRSAFEFTTKKQYVRDYVQANGIKKTTTGRHRKRHEYNQPAHYTDTYCQRHPIVRRPRDGDDFEFRI